MRKYDWFISGAVAMLYAEIANLYEAEKGHADKFNPDVDTTLGFVYTIGGEWFINWSFIFTLIACICFFIALGKAFFENKNKA